MITDFTELAQSLTKGAAPFAFCGIGVSVGGRQRFHLSSPFDVSPETFWRAASISKIVTARTALAAFQAVGVDPNTAAENILGVSFRPPGGVPPTLAQIASHQSGLWDDGGYIIPADVRLDDWLAAHQSRIWSGSAPDARFTYSNLGYVILAACAERATNTRFDYLAQTHVLGPLGLVAGFNWVGVPDDVPVLPTYRRTAEAFAAQIDAPRQTVAPGDIGQHIARLSPQGGLRVSLAGSLTLAEGLATGPQNRLWSADTSRTDGPTDLFQDYGWGLQIFDAPSFYPRPLIGHFANAYGFCGGVWWDASAQIAFAFALNGLPDGDEADGLRPEERAIFAAIAQTA